VESTAATSRAFCGPPIAEPMLIQANAPAALTPIAVTLENCSGPSGPGSALARLVTLPVLRFLKARTTWLKSVPCPVREYAAQGLARATVCGSIVGEPLATNKVDPSKTGRLVASRQPKTLIGLGSTAEVC